MIWHCLIYWDIYTWPESAHAENSVLFSTMRKKTCMSKNIKNVSSPFILQSTVLHVISISSETVTNGRITLKGTEINQPLWKHTIIWLGISEHQEALQLHPSRATGACAQRQLRSGAAL